MIKLSTILNEIQIQKPITWRELRELFFNVKEKIIVSNYHWGIDKFVKTSFYKEFYRQNIGNGNHQFENLPKNKVYQYYKELKALL